MDSSHTAELLPISKAFLLVKADSSELRRSVIGAPVVSVVP